MKYLVFSESPVDDSAFTQRAGAGGRGRKLPPTANVEELEDRDLDTRRRDPRVKDIIPSIPLSLVRPVGRAGGLGGKRAWGIEAVGALTSPENGEDVTVAVLDTGIDTRHPAFTGLAFGKDNLKDFTVGDQGVSGQAPDIDGHGTHVAGTIFGRDVKGRRIGVAPGIKNVLIGKVLGPNGASSDAVYRAIMWAMENRADVISMSLAVELPRIVEYYETIEMLPPGIAAARALDAYRSTVRLFDRVYGLVEALVKMGRGSIIVAASGNDSLREQNPRFTVPTAPPAAADGFIAVGAVSQTGEKTARYAVADFSNTGCLLVAPGVGILSARAWHRRWSGRDERDQHGHPTRCGSRCLVDTEALSRRVTTTWVGQPRRGCPEEPRDANSWPDGG